jgi:hypothetical protein
MNGCGVSWEKAFLVCLDSFRLPSQSDQEPRRFNISKQVLKLGRLSFP